MSRKSVPRRGSFRRTPTGVEQFPDRSADADGAGIPPGPAHSKSADIRAVQLVTYKAGRVKLYRR